MKYKTEQFIIESAIDELPISVMEIAPIETAPKAVVQLAHGMSVHKERYLPFMKYLAELGYCCVISSHKGHDQSKTNNNICYFFEGGAIALVEDLHQITNFIKSKHSKLPLYMLGYSMGSLVSRAYIKKYDYEINGLIVCGCPSNNKTGIHVAEIDMIDNAHRKTSSYSLNDFNNNANSIITTDTITSSSKETLQEYDDDPLDGFVFTLNGFSALLDLMNTVYSKSGWTVTNKDLPIWFISGEHDPCMISKAKLAEAMCLLQLVGYENVSHRLYSGMRHEILNEDKKEVVFKDIAKRLAFWGNK
jgi:alpha-beta hydrolase superfamily lysophospholipase